MVYLKDICLKASSSIAQKDLEGHEGQYPIYGAAGYIMDVDFYHQDKPYVAIVKDGAGIGRVMCLPAFSSVIGTLQYIIPTSDTNVHYLAYALEHMNLAKYYTGATIPHIYFKDYCMEKLPRHSWQEQQSIATRLSKVDTLIALRKQQITKLDELVKARFFEMFGDPEVNLHGFEIKSIGELVSVEPQNGMYKPQSSYVQDGTGTPILRIDAFYNGKVTDFHSLKRLTCAKAEIEKYLLHEHDIVINRVNSLEYLGKCAHIVGMYEPTVFESNMMRLHLDDTRADPCFITHLLCSDYVRKQIMNRAKKAVNQASINQNDVQSLLVLVPPVVLQHQFAAFVAQTDQQKLTIQHSLAQLELLKKALMQKYFG